MSRTLEEKVVPITGSDSGMGRSHAVSMAERGAWLASPRPTS